MIDVYIYIQVDLRREWSSEEGQKLSKHWGAVDYFECSAKYNEGVEEVFNHAIIEVCKDYFDINLIRYNYAYMHVITQLLY